MAAKYKRTLWGFSQLSYRAVEEYLSRMAKKGWFLERINERTAVFRRIEPCKLKFSVDLTDFDNYDIDLNHMNSGFDEYKEMCQSSGWSYVTHYAKSVIFCADEGTAPVPLQTDSSVEEDIVVGKVWTTDLINSVWGVVLGIAAFGLIIFISVQMNTWYEIITGLNIYSLISMMVVMIMAVVMLIDSVYWYVKYKRNKKQGGSLPQEPYLRARIKSVVYVCGRWLIIFCPLFFYLDSGIPWWTVSMEGVAYALSFVCLPVLIVLLALFVYPVTVDNMSGLGMVIMCIAVSFIGIIIVVSIPLISEKSTKYEDYIPAKDDIVRLTDVWPQEKISSANYNGGLSILYPRGYTLMQEGETCRLYVERFKGLNDSLAVYLFGTMAKAKYREGLIMSNATGEWNCDDLMISADGRKALIRKDSTVIYFALEIGGVAAIDLSSIKMLICNKLY